MAAPLFLHTTYINTLRMNTFDLSRNFWNWAFDNPEKISPNHSAIYFFAIEHCNRLGGKEKFGFPSQMTMDAIGIKKHSTYIGYFNDLVDWGFFKLIQKSKNQYSANIISLTYAMPKNGKALDKAIMNHRDKQTESIGISIGKSKRTVDKQLNNLTTKQLNNLTTKPYSQNIHECYDTIINLFPEETRPNNQKQIDTWKEEIRKLVDIDKYSIADIRHVIQEARADHFWSKNFLSIKKLRKKDKNDIPYIVVFINNFKNKNNSNGQQTGGLDKQKLASAFERRYGNKS